MGYILNYDRCDQYDIHPYLPLKLLLSDYFITVMEKETTTSSNYVQQ